MKERFKNTARTAAGWIRAACVFGATYAELWIAGLWFGATLWLTLWMWGIEPVAFPATDEAVNRSAALLVHDTGAPFLQLPFPDPEDLAHMRAWLTIGQTAIPAYPPLTFYIYGLLGHLGSFGYLLIAMFPASGAAAFASGVARLLPRSRRWLGLLAPALGFPAFYWLVRPWMNVSPMLSCLCWALFFWAHWQSRGGTRWLAAALFSVGAAVALRPDYAAHFMSAALVFTLAAAPEQWKRIVACTVAAGTCAVGVNLILNKILTGHALRPVYQLVMEGRHEAKQGLLATLIFPMGIPSLAEVGVYLVRYWLELGPLALLVFGQLALIPLWWGEKRAGRVLYPLGLLIVAVALASHVHGTLFGANLRTGVVSHSIPRYWAPIYLFAALPPLLFLGRVRWRSLYLAGAALACALVWLGSLENFVKQPTSFDYIQDFVRKNTAWLDVAARAIPPGAIVYSERSDKTLWSRWRVGVITTPRATAASIRRAVDAGLPVFILSPGRSRATLRVRYLLQRANLQVVVASRRLRLYRVLKPLGGGSADAGR